MKKNKHKNFRHTEESKKKISIALKGMFAGKKHPMYGKHHTKETKEKITKANTGRIHSEETKKKLSESKKGIPRPDLIGKKHTEEAKKKMSIVQTGKKFSKEHKMNLSKAMMGRPSSRKGVKLSDEQKKKQSESMKGKPSWNKGRKTPDEIRKKISKSRLEGIKTGKIKSSRKGKSHTFEANEKNRLAHLGKKMSEEAKKNMSTAQNKPETLQNNRDRFAKQTKGKNKETVPEKLLQKLCTDIGIKFIKQHNVKLGFQNHDVDVFIEPNICLEADGDRIHANPNSYVIPSRSSTLQPGFKPNDVIFGKSKSRKTPLLAKDKWASDKKIISKLEELGYVVLRFWHSELETNPEKCVKKILSIVDGN